MSVSLGGIGDPSLLWSDARGPKGVVGYEDDSATTGQLIGRMTMVRAGWIPTQPICDSTRRVPWKLWITCGYLALLTACSGTVSSTEPTPPPVAPVAMEDGALGDFHGVQVHRTTRFGTWYANDSIPDFDLQRYDTDGAWTPEEPDRITIPDEWEGQPVILYARGAWAGHTDAWVEMKLYCGATRPIGDTQEDFIVGVIQVATNPDSPFVELTTPPLLLEGGTECFIAFKTPQERALIPYGAAATVFGAYVP